MARPPRTESRKYPAVILDRDGVINDTSIRGGRSFAPTRLADFKILPGVPKAIDALKASGYSVIVATNQPDVGAGHVDRRVIDEMHRVLSQTIPVDGIYVCLHVEADGCACRKPKPGMLLAAAQDHSIDLSRSFMIGDRWRDIVAGNSAGCKTILIERSYSERSRCSPDIVVSNIEEAADAIMCQGPNPQS